MSCTHDFGRGASTCHCAACHETFTSVSAFDLHQRLGDDGKVVCLAPAYARNKKGSRIFTVVRLTPDKRPVYGRKASGENRPWTTTGSDLSLTSVAS